MGFELISSSTPVARKIHQCMASEFLRDGMGIITTLENYNGFTEQELADIKKAEANNWKVQVGEKYTYQVCKYDDIYVFKAITAIHNICLKYSFYPEL